MPAFCVLKRYTSVYIRTVSFQWSWLAWCLIVDGPVSRVARTVDLPIYDSEDCSNVVDINYGLCAGYFNKNKGVCSVSFLSSPPWIFERIKSSSDSQCLFLYVLQEIIIHWRTSKYTESTSNGTVFTEYAYCNKLANYFFM